MAPSTRATWLRSDRFLARSVARPVNRFLHIEASSGILLVAAAVIALVWANSPWAASYRDLWTTELSIDVGGHVITEDLRHWINDGLMAIFFFVARPRDQAGARRTASSPPSGTQPSPPPGALGGMLRPRASSTSRSTSAAPACDGWGIPMATDVAFALGVLALLGSRVPAELKVLLLALAIVDDVGAIIVIAAFYSDGLDVAAGSASAVGGFVLVALFKQARVRYLPVYVVLGAAVWVAMLESGVHATIAGVVLGLLAPARPFLPEVDADRIAGQLSADQDVTAAEVRSISFSLRESIPVTEHLENLLHPWTSYLIVPLFALANAGVEVSAESLRDAATAPVTLGVVVGLVVGKLVGVAGAIALVVRFGGGRLPEGITPRHVLGMAGIAGIGFTVSLFVAGLAFERPQLADQAKIGVLVASVVAAGVGASILGRGRAAPPV